MVQMLMRRGKQFALDVQDQYKPHIGLFFGLRRQESASTNKAWILNGPLTPNAPNTMNKITTKFKYLQAAHKGQIVFQHYGKDNKKTLVFSPIDDIASNMRCDNCKCSVWNATNFNNTVHFCPDIENTFEVSDYKAIKG